MLPYWLLFSAGSVLALTSWWRNSGTMARVIALSIAGYLLFFVGYRFQVGADWVPYEAIFVFLKNLNLEYALSDIEPAYGLINWVVGAMGGEVWHANLICSIFFILGLVRLCAALPLPGVAFLTAIPTLIIVVAMGYTRQAAALGCIMLAIRAYHGSFNWRWAGWLVLAAMFHNSAIAIFPIFVLAATRNRVMTLLMGALGMLVLLAFFILENAQVLLERYFEGEVVSNGALPRIGLAIIPAFLFFLIKDRKEILGDRYTLWRNMAFFSMALLPMIFLVRSTTVVDRLGVLLGPFQMLFYSLAPLAFAQSRIWRDMIIIVIIAMNAALLAIWLNFAEFSNLWVPYRNVLFEQFL